MNPLLIPPPLQLQADRGLTPYELTMLGKIDFQIGRHRHQAWLEDDLTWRCDDDRTGEVLNEIADDPTPTMCLGDDAVRHMLYRVAYRLGGRVSVEERRPIHQ